jgi:ankyrin repeat protein
MRRRKVTIPISIVLFLALTLVGTYLVRKRVLEKHLGAAMSMDDEAVVLKLVRSFPCPLHARDRHGRTPLTWALEKGRMDLVEDLLSKGADVNAAEAGEGRGWTPLHAAAWHGRKRGVEWLLRRRAQVGARDNYGQTPLHSAAVSGQTGTAEVLIAEGADVNAVDEDGFTPLHHAARFAELNPSRRETLLEMLIAAGARIDAKSRTGMTPLGLALYFRHEEIAALLRKHEATE